MKHSTLCVIKTQYNTDVVHITTVKLIVFINHIYDTIINS